MSKKVKYPQANVLHLPQMYIVAYMFDMRMRR